MNERRMLRRALEEMQNALSNVWDYHTSQPVPTLLREQVMDAQKQAAFALRVTSGTLPPGYTLHEDKDSGRLYPRKDGAFIAVNEVRQFFIDDVDARVFCWEHSEQHGGQK